MLGRMTYQTESFHTHSVVPSEFSPTSAVSYLRVSTLRQINRSSESDGFSIPAQRDANRRQAHGLGALIAAEFVERGQSGRSINRPELQRVLAYIQEHPVDYVIVHKLDRLARSRADDIAITQAIRDTGARRISSTESTDSSPNGTLLHGIMASIAEFYSRNLAQEVMKGMRQKVIQGGTPSRAPLGYLNVRDQTDDGREFRTVSVDIERAPHVIWAFESYATGEWSVAQLVAALEERGLRTRPTPSRPSAVPTVTSFHRILTNPYYKGIVTLNGAQHVGSHEPLVSTATWETVQRLLKSRRTGERNRIHTHYLKSTIYCFNCHRGLLVHKARSKTGRIYDYFVCSGRQKSTPRCTQRALPMADAEKRIERAYVSIDLPTLKRQQIERDYRQRFDAEAESRARKMAELDEQDEALKARQEKLFDLYYSDGIPREVLTREQRKLSEAMAQTEAERERMGVDFSTRMQQVSDTLDLLEGGHAGYLRATPEDRKQINNALFNRILIGAAEGELSVELRAEITEILAG
jgi:site-specific DNA recombinase